MSGRSRQAVAMWVGAGIAVVVVVAVLLTTLGSGGGAGTTTTVASPVLGATIPLGSDEATKLFSELPVPDGDYDAFCDAAGDQGKGVDTDDSLAVLRTVLDSDLDALIAVAPDGLVGSLTRLRDEAPVVEPVLDQVHSIAELSPADLPEGFLRDFGVVMRSTLEKCYGVSLPSAAELDPNATTTNAGG